MEHRPTRMDLLDPSWWRRSVVNRQRLPRQRWQRLALGGGLILGGILGFLPILGFWMIPLGLLVLSIDLPPVRRFRRRLEIWWGRRVRPAVAPHLRRVTRQVARQLTRGEATNR